MVQFVFLTLAIIIALLVFVIITIINQNSKIKILELQCKSLKNEIEISEIRAYKNTSNKFIKTLEFIKAVSQNNSAMFNYLNKSIRHINKKSINKRTIYRSKNI